MRVRHSMLFSVALLWACGVSPGEHAGEEEGEGAGEDVAGDDEERLVFEAQDATEFALAEQKVDRVRFYPLAGYAARMKGGMIQGSNTSATAGYQTLATIQTEPKNAAWTTLRFANTTPYRFIRYYSPNGWATVAELEFYSGESRVKGQIFATTAYKNDPARSPAKAFDGNTSTHYSASAQKGGYIGMDFRPQTPAASTAPSLPEEICPSEVPLSDTSSPTQRVGAGTAESCTESALVAAVAQGGTIAFNCGATTKTFALTQTLVAPANKDTIIDGNHRVVLDGQGRVQILRASNGNFRVNDRVLKVQRLTFANGAAAGANFVPRDGSRTCAWGYREGGGGAISTRDVNVLVRDVTFTNNVGPNLGPDVAGGAIYVVGAKRLAISRAVFRNNSASNGGAIGLLHTAAQLSNVVFENNSATGMLANFAGATGCPTFNHEEQGGAGGLGGAFYSDGFDPGDSFCGVRIANNVSGDLGGGVFRSAYWGLLDSAPRQTITWKQSVFEGNRAKAGGGGAAYVNNSVFSFENCTFNGNTATGSDGGALKITGISVHARSSRFTNNTSDWGGAVAHWGGGLEGAGDASGLSFSGNTPNDFVGDFPH